MKHLGLAFIIAILLGLLAGYIAGGPSMEDVRHQTTTVQPAW